jgi:hypothetical protein
MLQAGWPRVRFPMTLFFFHWPNPSSRTVALDSSRPLPETSTGNLPGGKGDRCVRLTTSPIPVSRLSKKCGSLDVLQLYRPPRPDSGILLPFFKTANFCYAENHSIPFNDALNYIDRLWSCPLHRTNTSTSSYLYASDVLTSASHVVTHDLRHWMQSDMRGSPTNTVGHSNLSAQSQCDNSCRGVEFW